MIEDTLLPFDLSAVQRKKVTADFEGGLISSDGGLVLLRDAAPGSRSPGPSSRPSGRACSRSAPGWSRRPRACASTSPRPVPTPPCSDFWPAGSLPRAPDPPGGGPREPEILQLPAQTPTTSNPGAMKAPNDGPCALEINRKKRRLVNKSG